MQLTISEKIMILRKRKGWSQADLAEAAGVSRNAISMTERNVVNTTPDTLVKIFRVFDTNLEIIKEVTK